MSEAYLALVCDRELAKQAIYIRSSLAGIGEVAFEIWHDMLYPADLRMAVGHLNVPEGTVTAELREWMDGGELDPDGPNVEYAGRLLRLFGICAERIHPRNWMSLYHVAVEALGDKAAALEWEGREFLLYVPKPYAEEAVERVYEEIELRGSVEEALGTLGIPAAMCSLTWDREEEE